MANTNSSLGFQMWYRNPELPKISRSPLYQLRRETETGTVTETERGRRKEREGGRDRERERDGDRERVSHELRYSV